eukprot:scaffold1389_cov251-Ochromonas_danica.AAC.31
MISSNQSASEEPVCDQAQITSSSSFEDVDPSLILDNTSKAITTKHDEARILHLRVDPGAKDDWTAALRGQTKARLHNDPAEADPWNRLARKFNDYTNYHYTNACIIPGRLDANECYIPVPERESIAVLCHDINPSATGGPIRDGVWLHTHYRDLTCKISLCFNRCFRSGNRDAENPYDEWVKFSTSFSNDVVTYARCIFDEYELDQLGPALPVSVQRDTGITDDGADQDPGYAKRRRAEQNAVRKRQRREAIRGPNTTSSSRFYFYWEVSC